MVADVIEEYGERFHQGSDRHESTGSPLCGTPGCIADWTMWVLEGKHMDQVEPGFLCEKNYGIASDEAGRALGLTVREQSYMFHTDPYPRLVPDEEIAMVKDAPTPAESVWMLRNYTNRDEVLWPMRVSAVTGEERGLQGRTAVVAAEGRLKSLTEEGVGWK